MQWVLMGLISILAGLIAGGTLWMAMDLVPKLVAVLRQRQERRALEKAAQEAEAEPEKGDDEGE